MSPWPPYSHPMATPRTHRGVLRGSVPIHPTTITLNCHPTPQPPQRHCATSPWPPHSHPTATPRTHCGVLRGSVPIHPMSSTAQRSTFPPGFAMRGRLGAHPLNPQPGRVGLWDLQDAQNPPGCPGDVPLPALLHWDHRCPTGTPRAPSAAGPKRRAAAALPRNDPATTAGPRPTGRPRCRPALQVRRAPIRAQRTFCSEPDAVRPSAGGTGMGTTRRSDGRSAAVLPGWEGPGGAWGGGGCRAWRAAAGTHCTVRSVGCRPCSAALRSDRVAASCAVQEGLRPPSAARGVRSLQQCMGQCNTCRVQSLQQCMGQCNTCRVQSLQQCMGQCNTCRVHSLQQCMEQCNTCRVHSLQQCMGQCNTCRVQSLQQCTEQCNTCRVHSLQRRKKHCHALHGAGGTQPPPCSPSDADPAAARGALQWCRSCSSLTHHPMGCECSAAVPHCPHCPTAPRCSLHCSPAAALHR